MRIIEPAKVDNHRDLFDYEVTKISVEHSVDRATAYVHLLHELDCGFAALNLEQIMGWVSGIILRRGEEISLRLTLTVEDDLSVRISDDNNFKKVYEKLAPKVLFSRSKDVLLGGAVLLALDAECDIFMEDYRVRETYSAIDLSIIELVHPLPGMACRLSGDEMPAYSESQQWTIQRNLARQLRKLTGAEVRKLTPPRMPF